MISIHLMGGLGNQLFQIAKCIQVSKRTGRTMWLPSSDKTVHSDQDYFTSIFQSLSCMRQNHTNFTTMHERHEYETTIENIQLDGYFQDYKCIPEDFANYLSLPDVDALNGAFIHIRGGDYKGHWLHDVGLHSYYEQAIQLFPQDTMFYIFTNDIEYAKTLSFLQKIKHQFIEEKDEVRSLALMKNCVSGGICPNSTFSWWGAYLNQNGRRIVLPSKWFNDRNMQVNGYFFPGSIII